MMAELAEMSFNPRAREGRDFDIDAAIDAAMPVSIHAPARGATVMIIAFSARR